MLKIFLNCGTITEIKKVDRRDRDLIFTSSIYLHLTINYYMKYSMTCTCGDVMSVEAESREEAVEKMKGMMAQREGIAQHMADKHPGEPVPSLEQVQAMITQNIQEAA